MKAFAIYDDDYNMGEKLCYIVKLNDSEDEYEFKFLLEELKEEYYEKIDDQEFFENNSLEEYVYDELTKRGYEFFVFAGEYSLS